MNRDASLALSPLGSSRSLLVLYITCRRKAYHVLYLRFLWLKCLTSTRPRSRARLSPEASFGTGTKAEEKYAILLRHARCVTALHIDLRAADGMINSWCRGAVADALNWGVPPAPNVWLDVSVVGYPRASSSVSSEV